MRLLRVGPVGAERPCVLREDGTVVDVSGLVDDFDGAFFDRVVPHDAKRVVAHSVARYQAALRGEY